MSVLTLTASLYSGVWVQLIVAELDNDGGVDDGIAISVQYTQSNKFAQHWIKGFLSMEKCLPFGNTSELGYR